MIAAIYARKSTEQERGESGDSLSVEEQAASATAFIQERGWTLGPAFKDEAVSGWTVPLEERPGGKALLQAARAGVFQVLVMRNESRLGREMADALSSLVTLTKLGIRVFYVATGQEVTLKTAKDKLLASIGNFGAEDYAERVSGDTRRGKLKRAQAGSWQGQAPFGYRIVREPGGTVTLNLEPAEAAVILTAFERVAEGLGFLRLAREIGKPATTIRAWLDNPVYRGVLRYEGRKDDGATVAVELDKPEWRIISEDLWQRAHARIARTRQTHSGHRQPDGRLHGRPESALVSSHLLAGHLRCGECGGGMFVAPRSRRRVVTRYWLCTAHYKQGNKTCANRFSLPYDSILRAVLDTFREHFTDPVALSERLRAEWQAQQAAPEQRRAQLTSLRAEQTRLETELARLAEAVASGGEIPALPQAMKTKQARRTEVGALLEHLDGETRTAEVFDVDRWLAETVTKIQNLVGTLTENPTEGRVILRGLLATPITVRPVVEAGRCTDWAYEALGALREPVVGRLSDPQRPMILLPPGLMLAPVPELGVEHPADWREQINAYHRDRLEAVAEMPHNRPQVAWATRG
jgi:site-specific DNA recombinase